MIWVKVTLKGKQPFLMHLFQKHKETIILDFIPTVARVLDTTQMSKMDSLTKFSKTISQIKISKDKEKKFKNQLNIKWDQAIMILKNH